MQVTQQPDEARLVGADAKQCCGCIDPFQHHLKRACGIDFVFSHLSLNLNVVSADIVHGQSDFQTIPLSLILETKSFRSVQARACKIFSFWSFTRVRK